MNFVVFSILFVWTCLVVRTGSALVGSVSLLQIVLSIPVSFVFYRFVFQVTYFDILHGILIFIMLGIGADDVFVFSDAWFQATDARRKRGGDDAESTQADSLIDVIAYAYQRTFVSVFNTSFTTAVAFLATAISPIMPIRSMGIYACILVISNYVFAITLTPSAYAAWHTYNLNLPCWRCCGSRKAKDTKGASGSFCSTFSFLEQVYFPIMSKPLVAGVFIVAFSALGCLNTYFASRLEAPTKAFEYFSMEHMHSRFIDINDNGFASGDESKYIDLQIGMGIAGVAREVGDQSFDMWKPDKFIGEAEFDGAFDMSKPEAQAFVRSFCQSLRGVRCTNEMCTGGRMFQPGDGSVSCFIEEFDTWNNGTFYEGAAFFERLKKFRSEEVPRNVIGSRTTWKTQIGFVGGELKFVQVIARMTLETLRSTAVRLDVHEQLVRWMDEQRAKAPRSVGTLSQNGRYDWVFMELESQLVKGLYQGFIICFPTAFLVLLFATQNLYVALYAIVTIFFVVMSVLGWCWSVEGWSLGVAESIAGVIVIGLAVDYAIHMGHMYLEAGHVGYVKRLDRWKEGLKSMGVTVFAGALTTFVAGIAMRFCQMTFFQQMSILISITVMYSISFTIFFFMSLLRLVGPEGHSGDITIMYQKIKAKLGLSPSRDDVSRVHVNSVASTAAEQNEQAEVSDANLEERVSNATHLTSSGVEV